MPKINNITPPVNKEGLTSSLLEQIKEESPKKLTLSNIEITQPLLEILSAIRTDLTLKGYTLTSENVQAFDLGTKKRIYKLTLEDTTLKEKDAEYLAFAGAKESVIFRNCILTDTYEPSKKGTEDLDGLGIARLGYQNHDAVSEIASHFKDWSIAETIEGYAELEETESDDDGQIAVFNPYKTHPKQAQQYSKLEEDLQQQLNSIEEPIFTNIFMEPSIKESLAEKIQKLKIRSRELIEIQNDLLRLSSRTVGTASQESLIYVLKHWDRLSTEASEEDIVGHLIRLNNNCERDNNIIEAENRARTSLST
ncbi:MAG TPA: hypothetical protein VGJ00_10120 [Rhabdochlamydiaceae bacterium]